MQIYINAFNNKKGINSMKHDARGSSNDLLRVIPDFHMGRTRQDMTHVFLRLELGVVVDPNILMLFKHL